MFENDDYTPSKPYAERVDPLLKQLRLPVFYHRLDHAIMDQDNSHIVYLRGFVWLAELTADSEEAIHAFGNRLAELINKDFKEMAA